jgi:hypothetical protein
MLNISRRKAAGCSALERLSKSLGRASAGTTNGNGYTHPDSSWTIKRSVGCSLIKNVGVTGLESLQRFDRKFPFTCLACEMSNGNLNTTNGTSARVGNEENKHELTLLNASAIIEAEVEPQKFRSRLGIIAVLAGLNVSPAHDKTLFNARTS